MSGIIAKAEEEVKTLASLTATEAAAVAKSPLWSKVGGYIASGAKWVLSFLRGITRTEWLVIGAVALIWLSLSPRHEAVSTPDQVAQCVKTAPLKQTTIAKRQKRVYRTN